MNFDDIPESLIDITPSFFVELVDHAEEPAPKSQVCELCGKVFSSSSTLKQHLKIVHEKVRDYVCKICKKSFPTNYKLTRHLTTHSNAKTFTCECGKDFKTRDPYLKHQRIHETGNEPFFCSICFIEFKYRSGFNYHNQMKHHKRPPPVVVSPRIVECKCEDCGKVLPNKSSYNRHKTTHEPRIIPCEQCNQKFKGPYDLQKHRKVHDTIYFRCRACPRFFKEQKILDVHMNFHNKKKLEKIQKEDEKRFATENAEILEIMEIIKENGLGPLDTTNDKEKKIIIESIEILPALQENIPESLDQIQEILEQPKKDCEKICEICGATFKTFSDLKRHTHRVHCKDDYKFICDKCPQRFPDLYDLKRHQITHINDKLYQCDLCYIKMKTKSSVTQHMKAIHLKDQTKIILFKCETCGRSYKQLRFLKTHSRVHSMDKRFNCSLCGEKFFYNDAVKWHKIRKHGEAPPFSCPTCSKSFIYQKTMEAHRKTHNEGGADVSICPVCGVTISESRNMKRHLRIHSEKLLICNYCPKKFREKHQLVKHQKTHATEIQSFEEIVEILQ